MWQEELECLCLCIQGVTTVTTRVVLFQVETAGSGVRRAGAAGRCPAGITTRRRRAAPSPLHIHPNTGKHPVSRQPDRIDTGLQD